MNADELLRHYERIADAPDAVARLRAFVVELAVNGRLFGSGRDACAAWPQLPLSRLLAEDTRNGYSRRPDEAADGVPILRISAGTVRPNGVVAEEEHKLISGIDAATRELYGLKAGDLLACRFNGNKRFVGSLSLFEDYARLRPIYPDKLIRIRVERSLVDPRFLLVAGNSTVVREQVEAMCATTVGNWGISASNLKTVVFPLPPLAEQHRIVAKVDELMALCDRLEAARAQRETARDWLVRSCLARLDTPDPETFRENARFALDALPALTARPDQIKPLRQTILNLAVRGKLVPQDPMDEPATELLRRIDSEKPREGSAACARGRNSTVRPPKGQLDFELPCGWAASTLGAIAQKITDGAHKTPTYVPSGIPFVSVKDFSSGRLDLANTRFISEEEHRLLYKRCDPKRGDILIARIGTLGRALLVDTDIEFSLFVSVGLIRFSHKSILATFMRLLLNSPLVNAEFDRIKIGGGTHTNKLNLGDLQTVVLPIPPFAEQRRIVAKVDELIALCDRLEASLTQADEHRRRLLEALLHQALEPAATLEEQAA